MTVEKEIICKLLPEIRKSENNLIAVCGCNVIRKCFLTIYTEYPPIEAMGIEEKKQLKKYLFDNFKGKDKNWMVETAKVIYTINQLI